MKTAFFKYCLSEDIHILRYHGMWGGGKAQISTTQPTTQNKTKQFGWSGIIIGKKPTPHHHTTTTTTYVITL